MPASTSSSTWTGRDGPKVSGGLHRIAPPALGPRHSPEAWAAPGSNRSFSDLDSSQLGMAILKKVFLSSILSKPTHSVAMVVKASFGT